ncbi:hypothetical protein CCACVL1_19577 [Corchorus capsularis]|uniref:Uncharacterized protein n=1 Tax=Corchorus capsularis TaxID=210143 RepID=A0A1R3HFZ3_COCAP|nr:hypothetical protein CCACVL1_19577 [Corchorus capsularis]
MTSHQVFEINGVLVRAEKLYVQRDEVAKGIVELIHRHSIKKLLMGAAADEHFYEY